MKTNKLYDKRLERCKKTIAFENDKPSTAYAGPATPASYMHMSMKDYLFDTKKGFNAYMQYVNKLNSEASLDCMNTPYAGMLHVVLSMIWLSKVKVPGRELNDDSLWQIDEKANLTLEDYDFIIQNGYDEFYKKFLPRVIDMNEVQEFVEYQMNEGSYQTQTLIENAYPLLNTTMISPPFEVLCGGRSMLKFYMDCYKHFDKVKETEDVIFPVLMKSALESLNQPHAIGAWIGGWRGASALVSPKIWDELVWPYMKKAAEILIDNNYIPIFHLDQNWDRDIERFLELPAKKCIINSDGCTDLKRARKLLGDHVSFMGDVPAPLLSTSSADKVEDYVKKLIDDVGPKGLFVCSGCDAPANAKFENMIAMYKTAVEYK